MQRENSILFGIVSKFTTPYEGGGWFFMFVNQLIWLYS